MLLQIFEDTGAALKFFNLDLHIAVIADIAQIFCAQGHVVDSWSISSLAQVMGRSPAKVDIVNAKTWRNIDQDMCNAFYERYCDELSGYDAFIVTHTPCFSMLYERWNKPVIVVASTRYEQPFSGDRNKWEAFNAFLLRGIDAGKIVAVANNKYDAAYAQLFTGRPWQVIASLCDYTNAPYRPSRPEFLYSSRYVPRHLPGPVVEKARRFALSRWERFLRRSRLSRSAGLYRWEDIAQYRGLVHVPYNASVMSIFEQYASGIPLIFPSQAFLAQLYSQHADGGVMSELSFNRVYGLGPGSLLPFGDSDPNAYDDTATMMHWAELSDFYDPENLAHIEYFDSFDTLEEVLIRLDLEAISANMVRHQALRRERAHADWSSVLGGLGSR